MPKPVKVIVVDTGAPKGADGAKVALASRERIEGEAVHATLVTEKWNLYWAGGLLAGNRKSRYQGLDAPPPANGGDDE